MKSYSIVKYNFPWEYTTFFIQEQLSTTSERAVTREREGATKAMSSRGYIELTGQRGGGQSVDGVQGRRREGAPSQASGQ